MGIATDLIIVVIAGLLGGIIAKKLNQPLILGYILAGIAVGPFTGGITVSEVEEIEQLAEIGVALLLFSLGLEFSLKSLLPIRAVALGGSFIQVTLTLLLGLLLGNLLDWGVVPSLWFSVAVASSSTAVILKTLASRGQMGTLSSRVMLGMSIVQDILIIPLMVVMMSLKTTGLSIPGVTLPLVKVVLFVSLMLFVGARFIPLLMKQVAQWESRELFLLSVTAVGLGIGYLTYAIGLSFAFGAFLAGLTLSESDYGRSALSDLIPVRDIFGLLFFVTIGMLFDPSFLASHMGIILILLAAVVTGKGVILATTGRSFGYRNIIPLAMLFGMIPISEISFIVLQQGLDMGAIDHTFYSLSLNVVIISMLLGPLATGLTGPAYALLKRFSRPREIRTVNIPATGLANHIIIAGGGTYGRCIAFALRSLGHPYIIIEPHHATFLEEQMEGLVLVYGDPGQETILQAAGIERAKFLIVTARGRMETLDAIHAARKHNADIHIIARAEGKDDQRILESHGVSLVIDPEQEAGLEMARQALIQIGTPASVVQRELEALRRVTYNSLFDSYPEFEALTNLRDASSMIHLEWFYLKGDNLLVDRKLHEAGLRSGYGLSVVAVNRGGKLIFDIDGDFIFRSDDYVAVVGTHEQNRKFFNDFGA
ncbi:MAG: cation:proton antiporter [Thermovirgaceae bacterium]